MIYFTRITASIQTWQSIQNLVSGQFICKGKCIYNSEQFPSSFFSSSSSDDDCVYFAVGMLLNFNINKRGLAIFTTGRKGR